MAAGFQLDQLLAACAELANIPPQEDSNRSQEQHLQQAEEQTVANQAEDSDVGDDLYADLLAPAGALNNIKLTPLLSILSSCPTLLADTAVVDADAADAGPSSVLMQQQQEQIQQVR